MTVACHPPTLAAARARIAAVRPSAYARTRNALDGAVSGLSPYITHGFVTLPQVHAGVAARHALAPDHKFVFELGWRDYFRHVWHHRGDGILRSLHEGPLPDAAYARTLPEAVRCAATGVPVVDEAVRTLYTTGTLHNHARMWLASFVVHLCKVHWRTGADWMVRHLLDGDLASNHLSWQWVAGTGSHKPYLFNAGNVARHAPEAWHSPGSLLDTGYDVLDQFARDASQVWRPDVRALRHVGAPIDEPAVSGQPPDALGLQSPDAVAVQGRDVWLVHPWNLGDLPELPADTLVIGVHVADFHRQWPWNAARWRFVGTRMDEITPVRWYGDAQALAAALAGARRVRTVAEPHLAPWLSRLAVCEPAPALFPAVDRRCESFSQWWTRASRLLGTSLASAPAEQAPLPW